MLAWEGRQTVLATRGLGKSDMQPSGHEPQSMIPVQKHTFLFIFLNSKLTKLSSCQSSRKFQLVGLP